MRRRPHSCRIAARVRLALAAIGVLGALLGASPASAATANRYGFAYLYGSYFRGSFLNLRSDALAVGSSSTDVVGNLSWVINTNSSPLQFIESGLVYGNATYGNCHAIVTPHSFFWADQRPDGSYNCHPGGAFSQGNYYGTTIFERAAHGSTWSVGVGPLSGTSYPSLTTANLIETGTEESTSDALSCSSSKDMQWYDSGGTLHSGWHDSSNGDALLYADNPPGIYWVNTPNWLRSYSPNKSTCGF